MLYRVVIEDGDNQVTLAEEDGKRSMVWCGDLDFDQDKLEDALDKLKGAKIDTDNN